MALRITVLTVLGLSLFSGAFGRSLLQVSTCAPSGPASNATTCPACGVAFGDCCPDGTCHVGTTCVTDPLMSQRKMCSPCGNVGEDCCGGTHCADPRFPTICNAIKKCEACGDIFLQCCRNASSTGTTQYYCANNATTCSAVMGQFMCMPKPTEPNGKSCSADANCTSPAGDSYICQDGGCQPCGTAPRRCCTGEKCSGDLKCVDGFCQPTGFLYNYCATGSACKNETWGKLTCNTTIDRCIPSIADLCPAAFTRNGSSGSPSGPGGNLGPGGPIFPSLPPVYGRPTTAPAPAPGTNSGTGGGSGNTSTCGKVFAPCCADGNCTDPATKCNGNFQLAGASVCSPCGQLGEDCCTSGAACREMQATTFCNSIGKCEACGNWFLKCCPSTNSSQPHCASGLSCTAGMCMPSTFGAAAAPTGQAIPQQCDAGQCSGGLVCRDNFCHVCGDFQNYCCAGDKCNDQPWGKLKCSNGRCAPA